MDNSTALLTNYFRTTTEHLFEARGVTCNYVTLSYPQATLSAGSVNEVLSVAWRSLSRRTPLSRSLLRPWAVALPGATRPVKVTPLVASGGVFLGLASSGAYRWSDQRIASDEGCTARRYAEEREHS